MGFFDTNITKLSERILPSKLYSQTVTALVKAIVSPIEMLRGEMLVFRSDKKYWIGITPQVCYLQKALNDALDSEQRRIIIENTSSHDVLLTHQDASDKSVVIHTDMYYEFNPGKQVNKIHLNGSYADGGADFNVHFPNQLTEKEYYTARKILDDNKLPDKSYNFPGQNIYGNE